MTSMAAGCRSAVASTGQGYLLPHLGGRGIERGPRRVD